MAHRSDVDIVLAMTEPRIDTRDVFERLREGNRRFAEGTGRRFAEEDLERRERLAAGQAPDAVVLTCADSRVAPTLVFDQGLGDLFVIRVAGNVVTPELLGSVEFAVDNLGTRLVVVLGHTGCGAVTAAVDALGEDEPDLSPNLRSIVDRILPAAERAMLELLDRRDEDDLTEHDLTGELPGDRAELGRRAVGLTEGERQRVVDRAVRLNVVSAVRDLRSGSELLDRLAGAGQLAIVGAEYSLESGTVERLVD